jgi:hypothetical protein
VSVWSAIAYVGSGLSLMAFLVAALLRAYQSYLRSKVDIINRADPKDLPDILRTYADPYRIDTSLSASNRAKLTIKRIKRDERRDQLAAKVLVTFACLVAVVALVAIFKSGDTTPLPAPPAPNSVPPAPPAPLPKSHFDIVDEAPTGAVPLAFTNARNETLLLYNAEFRFPAQSVTTRDYVFAIHQFGSDFVYSLSLDKTEIPARSATRLIAKAYGCDPAGHAAWESLMALYRAPKSGEVGMCKICMKATGANGEEQLCKEMSCNHMVIYNDLHC